MNDLISRSALMEDFRNTISEKSDTFDWLNMISRQPAYDVDKIVEKLAKCEQRLNHYEDLEEQGSLLKLPCKVGDTVYRICPKCNDRHDRSCEHCAWRTALSNSGCTVYGLWSDGQYPPDKCTIVSYKVTWNYIPNLLEHFGKTVFLTQAEAEETLKKVNETEDENG